MAKITHEFDVAAHNEQARAAQRHAGVNPDKCIALVEVPGGERTPLDSFFKGLSQRQYRMPAEHLVRIGNRPSWREHDIEIHARRVGALHPELVDVVVEAASDAHNLMQRVEHRTVKRIANAADTALSSIPMLWGTGLNELCHLTGSKKHLDALMDIQAQHFSRLVEYNPTLFQANFDRQRRV